MSLISLFHIEKPHIYRMRGVWYRICQRGVSADLCAKAIEWCEQQNNHSYDV